MKKTAFIVYLALILGVIIYAIINIATYEEPADEEDYYADYLEYMAEEEIVEEPVYTEEAEITYPEDDVVDIAEVEPQYPGGEEEMILFIQEHVQYPELSREMGEQGTVYVQFIVNDDGAIQNVKVLKGVSELLDQEAVRVIKKMPNWEPGMQDGEPVRVRYQIPIKFKIA